MSKSVNPLDRIRELEKTVEQQGRAILSLTKALKESVEMLQGNDIKTLELLEKVTKNVVER